jgi:hypothetical protein
MDVRRRTLVSGLTSFILLTAATTLTVADQGVPFDHPESDHYTTFAGLEGFLGKPSADGKYLDASGTFATASGAGRPELGHAQDRTTAANGMSSV